MAEAEQKSKQIIASFEGLREEPKLPILDASEVWDGETDRRSELPPEIREKLHSEEKVILVHYPELPALKHKISALDVCLKAAHAEGTGDIGAHGPTVASVNPDVDSVHESRYERQHGRDDLQAAVDLFPQFPKLLDTTLVSLAASQGVSNESYIVGQPYRQEKAGSIILINREADDPVGQKFAKRKGWGFPFYGSVDAPASYINAMAIQCEVDPAYLMRRVYHGRDNETHTMSHAFELAVNWLVEKSEENPEGLIEYQNPIVSGGIRNQGWKDSAGAMVHADGSWANSEKGIAAIEVQGFAYDAFRNAANIYRDFFDNAEMSSKLDIKAQNLRQQVLEKFWVKSADGDYFAMGTDRDDDGNLRQLAVRSSNMGRLLTSDILKGDEPDVQDKVQQTIRSLLSPDLLTRWGIRTLSSAEVAYAPFRYHEGTMWKHDSDEIAKGLSNHGYFGLDRMLGARTTALVNITGCFPEYISGEDTPVPHIPVRDTYVWNERYKEVYMVEQVPPLAQTWAATTELAKEQRYINIPEIALDSEKLKFEKEVLSSLK